MKVTVWMLKFSMGSLISTIYLILCLFMTLGYIIVKNQLFAINNKVYWSLIMRDIRVQHVTSYERALTRPRPSSNPVVCILFTVESKQQSNNSLPLLSRFSNCLFLADANTTISKMVVFVQIKPHNWVKVSRKLPLKTKKPTKAWKNQFYLPIRFLTC